MRSRLAADVVIVGSGIAGLTVALAHPGLNVHLVTKGPLLSGSSVWAQGGISAAVGSDDSPRLHAIDTIIAGAGLSEPAVTEVLTQEAAEAISFLSRVGTEFDLDQDGGFELAREAAHQRPRVLHAHHDATGRELTRALSVAAERAPHVTIHECARAREISLDSEGRVRGLFASQDSDFLEFQTRKVVLATGGAGQLFRFTTNPPEACAEGLALAARAGAVLSDVEFVQFHPTALLTEQDPLPLLTEALRGEGAHLVDEHGHRFMVDLHPEAELAPRDVVARGVWSVMANGGQPHLDARVIGEHFPEKFPTVFAICQAVDLDPRETPIPIVPAAHYHMGGVDVDMNGRSSVPGLWACGEVSSTGVHGANRLASNSLLEAVVFGQRVATDISGSEAIRLDELPLRPFNLFDEPNHRVVLELRQLMSDCVGLVRNREGLQRAIDRFEDVYRIAGPGQLRDRARTGWVIAAAALARTESRGAHYRSDYPDLDPHLKRHSRTRWSHSEKAWVVAFEEALVGAN